MLSNDDIEKIREITKEEIKKLDLVNYINEETEKEIIKSEISDMKHDLGEYNKELNLFSIEFRLKLIERLIINIEKINKLVLKLILALFIVSIILLISFILLRINI